MKTFSTVGMSREQIRDVYNQVLLDLYYLYKKKIHDFPFIQNIEEEIIQLEKTKKSLKKMLGD